MPPIHAPALVSLPPLTEDAALFALVVTVLLTGIVAARALLAWQALSARAAAARRRHARLDEAAAHTTGTFSRLRAQAHELNADVERLLWSLPGFDERIERARVTLADDRASLEELRRDDARALPGTVARIRGTLSVLRSARELRRTILG